MIKFSFPFICEHKIVELAIASCLHSCGFFLSEKCTKKGIFLLLVKQFS